MKSSLDEQSLLKLNIMKVSDYYYHLPKNLIAQKPLRERDKSKLLILNRSKGSIEEDFFYNLSEYLGENDCLVLNNSKVIPARLFAIKKDTGAKIEILLLSKLSKNLWTALIKPFKRVKKDTILVYPSKISTGESNLKSIIEEKVGDGIVKIRFFYEKSYKKFEAEGMSLDRKKEIVTEKKIRIVDEKNLEKDIFSLGIAPLPPYIKNQNIPLKRYQTIYAKKEGSVAAPTAGLHFTNEVFKRISKRGITIATITLHVSLDTFRPIKVDNIEDHIIHSEKFYLSEEQSELINNVKADGGRIIAVGTSTVRALESATKNGEIKPFSGETDLFIKPNYRFKMVDVIITNFHLPCSTLFIMICAFANKKVVMNAYNLAIKKKYRFYSFGDAMLIL